LPHSALVSVPTTIRLLVPHPSLSVGASKLHALPTSTVLSGLQVRLGAVVSTTVTVWLHWATFPHASVALQVRVALRVCPHNPLVSVLKIVTTFVPPTSVALGASKLQASPHSTVLSGAQVSVGAVVSLTVTVCWHSATFPQASVARHVRVAL